MDVARLAGVSRATVSRVLNGGRSVSETKVAKVLGAVDALGFSVNETARHLRKGRTGSVAFVISEKHEQLFEDPNFGIRVKTFTKELEKLGLHLLISTLQDRREEAFLGNYLTAGHVDGVLLALVSDSNPLLAGLLDDGVPLVVLGRPPDNLEKAVAWVAMDDEGAAYDATRYLMAQRRTRVATITGALDGTSANDRLQGYRRALGRRHRKGLEVEGDWSLESGRRGTEVLLERYPDIDGLFVASDLMAAGAIKALKQSARRVPTDVAVIGVDDSASALTTDPSLSTMRNPFEETAEAAVRLLSDRMSARPVEPQHIVLPSRLVRRGSA
jgi:DNA-binding LacI/PurR family transcriptional regulator